MVRFGELRGLSSLPIPGLRDQFRYEEVLTVLPVHEAASSRETLFVATRPKLAILTSLPLLRGQWMTRWAAWEAIAVTEAVAPPGPLDEYRLDVLIGGQVFHAQLRGESGRKALRDFVIAVRTSQAAQHATR